MPERSEACIGEHFHKTRLDSTHTVKTRNTDIINKISKNISFEFDRHKSMKANRKSTPMYQKTSQQN